MPKTNFCHLDPFNSRRLSHNRLSPRKNRFMLPIIKTERANRYSYKKFQDNLFSVTGMGNRSEIEQISTDFLSTFEIEGPVNIY